MSGAHVTCQVSRVSCHMSDVQVVELSDGGSVIKGAASSFYSSCKLCLKVLVSLDPGVSNFSFFDLDLMKDIFKALAFRAGTVDNLNLFDSKFQKHKIP